MGKPQDAPSIGPPAIGILSLIVADILVLVVQDNKVRGNNVDFLVEHFDFTSLLPETYGVYPRYYRIHLFAISKIQLGYLPLPLYHWV